MTEPTQSQLLRRALRGNGLFSTVSGFGFLLGAKPIAAFIGLEYPLIIAGIGVSLLVFAVGLFLNASRIRIDALEAKIAVVLDLGWVLGTSVVLALGILNTSGNWTAAIIADIVLVFAILQAVGVQRLATESS